MEEFQNYSLSSRVFQRLREDILSGKYAEHDELRENTIGKELGVSRTPIREAMRKLEQEGLVVMIPRRGAQVANITEKDLNDVLEVRIALENVAIEKACKLITEEDIEQFMNTLLKTELYIYSDSTISEIVLEEAIPFFMGTKEAREVAKLIDSRVSLYLAEKE